MDTLDEEYGRLFENLQTEVLQVEPKWPMFNCYGGNPQWWNWYGGPYVVRSSWNPKNYWDLEYRNNLGQLHRIYGPAYVSRLYKIQAWYKEGLLHRVGGPAYIHKANMAWFYEGKLHNLDGPAVVEGGGPKQYWIMGSRMSKKEYEKEIKRRKRKGLIK